MAISRKEIISYMQLMAALICIAILLLSCLFEGLPDNWKTFCLQCACCSTAIICLIFALSTWCYNSNFQTVRLETRIYMVTVQWILFIGVLATTILFYLEHVTELMKLIENGEIKKNATSDKIFLLIHLIAWMGILVALLLLTMNVFLTTVVWLKRRRYGHIRRVVRGKKGKKW